jgi:hypothetical protein
MRGVQVSDEAAIGRLSIEVRRVANESGPFRGELAVETGGGTRTERELVGADCSAVVLSLVLVAALTLGPTVELPAGVPPNAPPADRPGPIANPGPSWIAGVRAEGMSALGPNVSFGVDVSAERVVRLGARAASLSLSLGVFAPQTASTTTGQAEFRAYLAGLEGCWFGAIELGGSLSLSPCAGVKGGLVEASGELAQHPSANVTRGWIAPQASARVYGRLTRHLWLAAGATAFFPLVRDDFVFQVPRSADVQIYRVPVAGGAGDVGVAGAFW